MLFAIILFSQDEKDIFHFKDGTTIIGQVITENDSVITVQSKFGQVDIRKQELVDRPSNDEILNKQIRDDLEFDFTAGHTALSQYHGFALTTITESNLSLLVNGGSYFVISGMARRLNNLSRIKSENSIHGHGNGIGQGMLASLILLKNPEFDITMAFGSIGGLYHGYHSYNTAHRLPDYQSAFILSAESLAPLWLVGTFFSLPDKIQKNIFEIFEENPRVLPTALLATSLSANFWASGLIGDRNLSYGDFLTAEQFHSTLVTSTVALVSIIEPENTQFPSLLLLGSSGLGLYWGIKTNEGNQFTFEEGRLVSRMTGAGSGLGIGLGALLEVDDFKAYAILASAGMWAGYFYGKHQVKQKNRVNTSWDFKINPGNLLLASRIKNTKKPMHFPLLGISYKF